MKNADIQQGKKYYAKVSGRVVTVEVTDVYTYYDYKDRRSTQYSVRNLNTGRTLRFRSARRFIREAV